MSRPLFFEISRAIVLLALSAAAPACEPPTRARDVATSDAASDSASNDGSAVDGTATEDGAISADSGVTMDAIGPSSDASQSDAMDAASLDAMDAASSDGTTADVTSDRGADVSSDGACASPPTPEAPVGGACRTNWLLCGGTCVDRLSDDNNCGACGNRCAAGSFCYIGLCFCSCTPPLICCSDSCSRTRICADTRTDARHCGGCYRRCAAGQSCVDGMCR